MCPCKHCILLLAEHPGWIPFLLCCPQKQVHTSQGCWQPLPAVVHISICDLKTECLHRAKFHKENQTSAHNPKPLASPGGDWKPLRGDSKQFCDQPQRQPWPSWWHWSKDKWKRQLWALTEHTLWGQRDEELHCPWSLAGTICAVTWQDSQNAKANQTGCAVSTGSRASASLPLCKRKGCWSLGSPRAKRLQLPHWFCSGLRLTTAKTFHDLAVLCRVCHSKPPFGWTQRKSQTHSFKRGEKNEKPQLKQLLPSASLTPRVETRASCFLCSPHWLRGQPSSMLFTLSREELPRDLRWRWWK